MPCTPILRAYLQVMIFAQAWIIKKVHVEADSPVLAQAITGSEHDLSIAEFISIKIYR
jgi:hypothetical protein